MDLFKYDSVNARTEINQPSVLLIREFRTLWDVKRNITVKDKKGEGHTKAIREFTYMYLYIDWTSPYFNLTEQDKHKEALADAELTDEEFNDPLFREGCRKYEEIQNSNLSIQMLKGAQNAVRSVITQLNDTDLSERDPLTGKPIFKTKDVIAEIKGCKDLISGLNDLENQVKRDIAPDTKLRGNVTLGFDD